MSGLDALRAERQRFAGELAALRSSASSRGSPNPSTASRMAPSVSESTPRSPEQSRPPQPLQDVRGGDPSDSFATDLSPTESQLQQPETATKTGGNVATEGVDSPSLRGSARGMTRVSASLITTTAVPARDHQGGASPAVRGSSSSVAQILLEANGGGDASASQGPLSLTIDSPEKPEVQHSEEAATEGLAKHVSNVFQAQQSGKPWMAARNDLEEALAQAVSGGLDLDGLHEDREDLEAARAYLAEVSSMLYSDHQGNELGSRQGAEPQNSPKPRSPSPGGAAAAPEAASSPSLVRSASPASASSAQARMSMLSHVTSPIQPAMQQTEHGAAFEAEGRGQSIPGPAASVSPEKRETPSSFLQSLGQAAEEVSVAIDGLKNFRASLESLPPRCSTPANSASPLQPSQAPPGVLRSTAVQTGSPVTILGRGSATSPTRLPTPPEDDSAPEPRRLPPRLHARGAGPGSYPQAFPGGHPFQPSIGYPTQYLPNPPLPVSQWAHHGGPWMHWAPWGLPPSASASLGGNRCNAAAAPAPHPEEGPAPSQHAMPSPAEGSKQPPGGQQHKAREAVGDGLQKVQNSFWDLAASIIPNAKAKTGVEGHDTHSLSPEGPLQAQTRGIDFPQRPMKQAEEAVQRRPQHVDHPGASLPPKIASTFQRAIDELHKERRVIPPQPIPLPEPQLHKVALTATQRAMGGAFDYSSAAASLEELHQAAKDLEDGSKFDSQQRKQAANMVAFSRHGPSLHDESTFDDGNMLKKAMEQEVEARIAAAYQAKSKRSTRDRYAAHTLSSRGVGPTPGRALASGRQLTSTTSAAAARPASPLKGLSARDPLPRAPAASGIPRPASGGNRSSRQGRAAEFAALQGPPLASPPQAVDRPKKRKAVPMAFGTRVKEPLPVVSPPVLKARTPKRVRKDFVPRVAGLPAKRSAAAYRSPSPGETTAGESPEIALRPSARQAAARESPHSVSGVRTDFLREMARAAGLVKDSPPRQARGRPAGPKQRRAVAQVEPSRVQQLPNHEPSGAVNAQGGPLYDMLHALASALLDKQQGPGETAVGPHDGSGQPRAKSSIQQKRQQQEPLAGAAGQATGNQPEFHSMRSFNLPLQPQFDKVVDLRPVNDAPCEAKAPESSEGRPGTQSATSDSEQPQPTAAAVPVEPSASETLAVSMDDWVASRVVAEMLVKHLSKQDGAPGSRSGASAPGQAMTGKAEVAKSLQVRQASVPRLACDVDPAMAELITYEAIAEIVGQALPNDTGDASPADRLPGETGVIVGGGSTAAGVGSKSIDDAMVQLILRALSSEDTADVTSGGSPAGSEAPDTAAEDPSTADPEGDVDGADDEFDRRSIGHGRQSSPSAETVDSDRSASLDSSKEVDEATTSPVAKDSSAAMTKAQPMTPALISNVSDAAMITTAGARTGVSAMTPAPIVSQSPAVPTFDAVEVPQASRADRTVNVVVRDPTLGQRLAHGGVIAARAVASRLPPRPTLEESVDYAISDDDETTALPCPESPATPPTPDDVSASLKALILMPPLPRMKALEVPEQPVAPLRMERRMGRADAGPVCTAPGLPEKGQHRLWRLGQRLATASTNEASGAIEPISELSALSLSDSLDSSTVSSNAASSTGDSFEAIAPMTSRSRRLGAGPRGMSPHDVATLADRRRAMAKSAGVDDSLLFSENTADDDTELSDGSRSVSSSSDLAVAPHCMTGMWEPREKLRPNSSIIKTTTTPAVPDTSLSRRRTSDGTLSLTLSSSTSSSA